MTEGRRIDQMVAMEVGVPVDLGWATAILNPDETLTRTCKGCGATATSKVTHSGLTGRAETAEIHHGADCPVELRLGNNPGRS